jgi:FkbM family methyltransferase
VEHAEVSNAQLFQDLFVLFMLGGKRNGFFVEFGATKGIDLSNTVVLERHYGWTGILAEPALHWHLDLSRNRSCAIDYRCVWSTSGKRLEFNETEEAEFSTIQTLSTVAPHAPFRQNNHTYQVETITLTDLLKAHNAPTSIDYLSVDTEGSELEILDAFFPATYDISLITVDHTRSNAMVFSSCLVRSGYRRIYQNLCSWDYWYFKPTNRVIATSEAACNTYIL